MEAKVYWLFAFVALYWCYCIFWGIKSARTAKTASDYFIAGRRLSMWVFVLAATATWHTHFGVNAADPVNYQNDLSGGLVDIDDDLVDQRPNDALLQARVGTRIFP